MKDFCLDYAKNLSALLESADWGSVIGLVKECQRVLEGGHSLYICGNGGSAGNAMHLANDFLYGISPNKGKGLNVEALSANSSVITCLANDVGYDNIYSRQLSVKGKPGDLLLILSGSGNSPNITQAIKRAKELKITSAAILGFDGGEAKNIADIVVHFAIDDMQISEDLQLVVGHMIMRLLNDEGATC